jgi:5-methylthioadenosine/S-adenosylhomocysteine deaminase
MAARGVPADAAKPELASATMRARGCSCVRELDRAGIPVALGIDQAGIDDDRDMLQEMRLAWTLQPAPRQAYGPLTEARIFRMASEHGAATSGFAGLVGRLAPGRAADIAVIHWEQLARPYLDPDTEVVSALVQRAK